MKKLMFALLAVLTVVLSACGQNAHPSQDNNIAETTASDSAAVHVHNYAETILSASCSEDGYREFLCFCGHSYREVIAKVAHDYQQEVVAPTCTQAGYTRYKCKLCADAYTENPIEPTGHSYEAYITPASCVTSGYTTYTCACGDSYVGDETPINTNAHIYAAGICSLCSGKQPGYGLCFEWNEMGYYVLTGIGTCTDTELVIPETYNSVPVKEIGSYALQGCTSLTSVTIPSSIQRIGNYAFNGCSNLATVNLTHGLVTIGAHAFSSCASLTSITIPGSILGIGDYAFYRCDAMTSLTIEPGDLFVIDPSAFSSCYSLVNVSLPDNISVIRDNVFYDCRSLESIVLPKNLTDLDMHVFYGCSKLAEVTITGDYPHIHNLAFKGVTATVYYPSTWDRTYFASGGGDLTWVKKEMNA